MKKKKTYPLLKARQDLEVGQLGNTLVTSLLLLLLATDAKMFLNIG